MPEPITAFVAFLVAPWMPLHAERFCMALPCRDAGTADFSVYTGVSEPSRFADISKLPPVMLLANVVASTEVVDIDASPAR